MTAFVSRAQQLYLNESYDVVGGDHQHAPRRGEYATAWGELLSFGATKLRVVHNEYTTDDLLRKQHLAVTDMLYLATTVRVRRGTCHDHDHGEH